MVRRAAFVLLWVFATMLATGMGLAAVRGVAGEVVDQPASELLAIPTPTTESAQPAGTGDGGSKLPPLVIGEAEGYAATSTTEVPVVEAPDSEPEDGSGATIVAAPEPPAATVATTTTTPPAEAGETPAERSTTTTRPLRPPPPPDDPPGAAEEESTYQLLGGWVRLTYSEGIVQLDAAGPASGYTMIISGNGPERVNIVFRSSNHLSRLRAEWRGAELEVDIVEEARRR
ncbi:MAG TPA: hypothetical protein VLG28_18165 [Acidimicrobiia bacterium]|jgi:hypothetical protein|nr:hypothetical protein [Acidimicrobiia bacterium]